MAIHGLGMVNARASVSHEVTGQQVPGWVRGFDEIFVRQLLQQLHSTQWGPDGEVGASGYRDLADDHLARIVAATGGVGVGKQLWTSMRAAAAYRQIDAAG